MLSHGFAFLCTVCICPRVNVSRTRCVMIRRSLHIASEDYRTQADAMYVYVHEYQLMYLDCLILSSHFLYLSSNVCKSTHNRLRSGPQLLCDRAQETLTYVERKNV